MTAGQCFSLDFRGEMLVTSVSRETKRALIQLRFKFGKASRDNVPQDPTTLGGGWAGCHHAYPQTYPQAFHRVIHRRFHKRSLLSTAARVQVTCIQGSPSSNARLKRNARSRTLLHGKTPDKRSSYGRSLPSPCRCFGEAFPCSVGSSSALKASAPWFATMLSTDRSSRTGMPRLYAGMSL